MPGFTFSATFPLSDIPSGISDGDTNLYVYGAVPPVAVSVMSVVAYEHIGVTVGIPLRTSGSGLSI